MTCRWGGLLLALGIAAGAFLSTREAKRRDYDPQVIYYLFLPLVIWGMVGARLWHIFTPPLSSVQLGLTTGHYLTHFLDVLAMWIGGFGIPGAWIGSMAALFFFARRNELDYWELADVIAPGALLAQVFGRWGNYFNQELYGLPSNLPWKIFIAQDYRLMGYESIEYYHPLFAYEMFLNLASLLLLLWIGRRYAAKLKAGDIFLVYLGSYSFIRAALEFLRLDVSLVNGININQLFFLVVFLGSVAGIYLRHRLAQEL